MMRENKTGPKAFGIDKFIELLDSKNYKLVPGYDHEYKNTKSVMRVIDSTGKLCTKSYANLKKGHKSMNEMKEEKKVPVDEVMKRVDGSMCFSWMEGITKYVGKDVPMTLWCNVCNNTCKVRLENIRGERYGCSECYRYNRTYTWEYYEDIAEKYGCTIVPCEEYKGRDTMCYIICNCTQRIEKTARYFAKAPRCKECSDVCRSNTNMEKYGTENVFGSEYGKEKIQEWLDSKGVKGNMAIPEVREKSMQTCMENHGVPHYCMKQEIKKMAEEAHEKKYGTKGFGPMIYPKCKATMLKNWGYEYPMQVAEIFDKAQKKRYKGKMYTFPSGRIERVMGYEPECLDYLLKKGYHEDDLVVGNSRVPIVMYNMGGKKRRYYMDIYIKSKDRAVEVKCCYTYHGTPKTNEAKWIQTSKNHKGGIDVYVIEKHARMVARKRILDGKVITDRQWIYSDYKPPPRFEIPLVYIYRP